MFSISFDALTKNEKIGEGGFGIVYKGTYRFGPAAIKQLQIDNLSPEAEEEFNKEANIMAQLHHPHIVHFYGYCSVPKCLVMEYMPKGSLFKVLHSKEPLDWNIRMRIATDIVSGLAFLHSSNILHRDIKSLNVLLDAQMGAKLTDFGLSQVKNETKSKTMATKTSKDSVGTVQWMAPELFKRKAVYTQKSDIYSLGITFWELAARQIPYAKDTQAAIPTFVQQGEREDIPQDCPEKLAHLIQQCWASDPTTRPNAADIARFMMTDAKTLNETMTLPKSSVLESAGDHYQLISQVTSGFMPSYQNNSSPSLAALSLQSNPTSLVTSPKAIPKRRGSNILNLADKKEEQEKIRHVLEALKNLFLEERDDGEKTENYAIYNEYLKKAHNEASLVYKEKQNKHVLTINDESLDVETAVKEISKMLKSLTITVTSNNPQANTPTIASALKVNPPMLTQLNQALKLSPAKDDEVKVKADDLKVFLRLVAEGEQNKAEAMLKSNSALALVPGDVIDLSKRTFTSITAFQYASWALDWHMWTMIRKYLPDNEAKQQAEGFETGGWVKQHGVHAQHLLDGLVKALQTSIDLCNAKKWDEGNVALQQVGGAQILLPAHVINEYCHPTRPFYPLPNFRDNLTLPRTRTVDKREDWDGKLGEQFFRYRAKWPETRSASFYIDEDGWRGERTTEVAWDWLHGFNSPGRMGDSLSGWGGLRKCVVADLDCMRTLSSTRTAQREELIAELRSKSTQKNNTDLKELGEFLKLVAEGEQDKAEAMLKINPALALVRGDVTDLSKRTFTNITAFQYAVWALDWHMWTMIRKYLPNNEAKQQAEGFETDTWVRQHGVHAQHLLDNLVKALQATIDLYELKKWNEGNKAWVQEVGGAQCLLPAHVVNEYCHPRRSFDPCPNFRDPLGLPRSRMLFDKLEWFTAKYNGGKLGDKFAIYRGQYAQASSMWVCSLWRGRPASQLGQAGIEDFIGRSICSDHRSLSELIDIRVDQRDELINELRPRNVQQKAA